MNQTNIEWADVVWNPVTGCTPVSAGCKHCYARTMAETRLRGRAGYDAEDPFKVTLRPEKLDEPIRARKAKRIFVCSMGDLFHEDVPDKHILRVLGVAARAQHHTFMFLTKRPHLLARVFENRTPTESVLMEDGYHSGFGSIPWPLPNVWLGVSVEDQATADERTPLLLDTPAALRFVSVEPMLGPVGLGRWGLNWVIAGPETGAGRRRCQHEWIADLFTQCRGAHVPFFDKRNGHEAIAQEWPKVTP